MLKSRKATKLSPIERQLRSFHNLKLGCRALIVATIVASVWANVLHAQANIPSILISAFPPLIILGGFEIISRIPLNKEASILIRAARPLATILIVGIGVWLSYQNQREAFANYADQLHAKLLPIAIDGLMVIASVSLIELNHMILRTEALGISRDLGLQNTSTERQVRQPRKSSKRDSIVKAIRKMPLATDLEIASLTGAHRNYVNNVRKELQKEQPTMAV